MGFSPLPNRICAQRNLSRNKIRILKPRPVQISNSQVPCPSIPRKDIKNKKRDKLFRLWVVSQKTKKKGFHDMTARIQSRLLYASPASMLSSRMLTALRCASSSSIFAICMTAVLTLRKPCCVRFELVMCFVKEERLTPEYCLAYP